MQQPEINKLLNDAQIESLYTFCVKHYVRDYDVQIELVDHFVSSPFSVQV